MENLKKAVTSRIVTFLEGSKSKGTLLAEAKAENMERFINYENDENEELAARIRKGATVLADYIAKIEKMYLETRDNIEKVYGDIGAVMAPAVAVAFKDDLKPVLAKYFTIDIPNSKKVSPEDIEKLGVDPTATGALFTNEGKIIKEK